VGYRFGTGLDYGSWGGTVSASDNAACARRACDVHFTATFAGQAYAERLGIWDEVGPRLTTAEAFVLTATAHAGEVRDLTLDDRAFLRQDGVLYPASGRPIAVTTHHNTYLIFFPKADRNGRPLLERTEGQFDVLIKDPAGDEPRVLTFNYPLVHAAGASLPLPQVMVTLGAAMAALLFACTPCLVGSLAVGSMTTGAAVSYDRKAARAQVRRRIVRQTLIYLAAIVVAYLAVASAVSLLDLEARALRPIELIGGLALVVVGFSLLRAWRPLGGLYGRAVSGFRQIAARRDDDPQDRSAPEFDQGSASAMGASLAMVCSVAGAPTLSTAILLPLLVYAGLSHPLWAVGLLAVYLLVCAVPFFFVAVGWGEFLVTASMRWRTGILIASGVVLVALGLLLVVSPAAVAGMISAPARFALVPFRLL
jgi:cytochrome c biogenesis protein CcdA